MPEPYRFPGIVKFLASEGVKPSLAGKVSGSWLMSRFVDAVSQGASAPPEHRAAIYANAREMIAAMNATTATAVAALDEVMRMAPPLATPDDPPPSKADPFAAKREAKPADPIPATPPQKGK